MNLPKLRIPKLNLRKLKLLRLPKLSLGTFRNKFRLPKVRFVSLRVPKLKLRKRRYLIVGGVVLLAGMVASATTLYAGGSDSFTIPDRTPIHVTLDQTLATNKNKAGDHFEATVNRPVVVNGNTVIPKGARVDGIVVDARKAGYLKGKADLRLILHDVRVNGQEYEVHTASVGRKSIIHTKRNLLWIGGGAGGGVLIGALAGGGEGAAIGGPVGAAAGVGVAYFTSKRNVKYPAETRLTFRLAQPASINNKS
jgi:hypothetical protein